LKFESKKKFLDINVDGKEFKMSLPTVGESEELEDLLEKAQTNKEKINVYRNLFERLGFPIEDQKKMDSQDFFELIKFVLNPKKNSATDS